MVIIADYSNEEKLNLYKEYYNWFPFQLSPFQIWSINSIIEGNHSLITAHTGSGKTIPAEFAIKYFTSKGKKIIYTTPIKALSNQKLHDFRRKFPEISFGILTGDIEDNREAQVLIMTTEILANSLMSKYTDQNISSQSELDNKPKNPLRFEMDFENELALVVFDEVHYIADQDRGHAWEQSIILLPKNVQLLMLSATISEPEKFAKWVETKNNINFIKDEFFKEVVLSSTNERVVPLKHYAWFAPFKSKDIQSIISKNSTFQLIDNYSNKLITLRNGDSQFLEQNYIQVLKLKNYIEVNKFQYFTNYYCLTYLIDFLKKNKMLPSLCFLFSRKQVEEIAKTLVNSGKINLFDDEDDENITSNKIQKECRHILSSKLSNYQEYINLPEYSFILSLLEKGIGIHHAGVLPILRELIEILDEKGFIKLLFATETFAVGVNMPTKSVIFTSLRKFSNSCYRYVLPFEYTQMAGRAGRRGLDSVGHVIHMCNLFTIPSSTEMCTILTGKPQTIKSQFHISYNLILNTIQKINNIQDLNKKINNNNFLITLLNEFCSQSLIKPELDYELKLLSQNYNDLLIKLDKLKLTISTPIDIIKSYKDLLYKLSFTQPKHKKSILKEIENLINENKNLKIDFDIYIKIEETLTSISDYENKINNNKNYFINEIKNSLKILLENNFIEIIDDQYKVTRKGFYASSIQEAHNLAVAEILDNMNYFNDLTNDYISQSILFCGFLSMLATISIPDDYRLYVSGISNEKLRNIGNTISILYEKYYDLEIKILGNQITQDFKLTFDICEPIMEWCKSQTNQDCQYILEDLKQYDIFTGEYIKAVLKIVKMCKELEKPAEYYMDYNFLKILKNVPELLLKYIATNQSLYI